MKPTRPYADSRLAKFIEKRVLELRPRKPQNQIAVEAGYLSANMISMIKDGTSKVALDRIPALAKALECDARLLFRMALNQEGNETFATAVEEIFGTIISKNEAAWLAELRNASDETDPSLTSRGRAALRSVFNK